MVIVPLPRGPLPLHWMIDGENVHTFVATPGVLLVVFRIRAWYYTIAFHAYFSLHSARN